MLGSLRLSSSIFLFVLATTAAVACGSDDSSTFDSGADAQDDATVDVTGGPETGFGFDTGSQDGTNNDALQGFDVQPSTLQTITVPLGQTTPTVQFTATYNGQPVGAGWIVDRGNLASVGAGPSSNAVVVPTGTTGGLVTLTAGLNNQTITRQIFIKITATQNGPNTTSGETAQTATTVAQLTAGGGVGGVGGEGLGSVLSDQPTQTALGTPSSNGGAQNLAFLYPYDATVFPRGLLAPLMQWDWTIGDADGIQVTLATTSGSFSYTGTFGRPTILNQTGGNFIRMPVPQDIWDAATNSAGGPTVNNVTDKLTLGLTVAKSAVGYGPITQTYTIAPGRLDGIIYYNSYGTQLAQNYSGAVGGNGKFGGAVLSIHVGDTAPQLTAGANGGTAQCRVCHSVAAKGSMLVAQHGDSYNTSSAYSIGTSTITESTMTHNATFPGIYPDGTLALTFAGQLLPLPTDTTPIATTGLTNLGTNLGTPAFSPDGKFAAVNPMSGTSLVTAPGKQIFVVSYDNNTHAFTSPTLVVDDTGKAAGVQPGWPAFFPDGQSLVFHHQSVVGSDGTSGAMYTRKGCQAQIHWTSSANDTSVTALNELNGLDGNSKSYLPVIGGASSMNCTADGVQVGATDATHSNDVNYNYEPTVNPVPSGGYVWVVFTSRRRYGSVATVPPFCSDPRGVNLVTNITTKKLWVAAIDLNAKPGTDASHPGFYLPAQEILAGNSRGFWVLDPCRANGTDCTSGDQCCNGFCEQADLDAGAPDGGDGGAGLVCQNKPPNATCSKEGESCQTSADCCDSADTCSGGFCVLAAPH
jgi:hypothetical protein